MNVRIIFLSQRIYSIGGYQCYPQWSDKDNYVSLESVSLSQFASITCASVQVSFTDSFSSLFDLINVVFFEKRFISEKSSPLLIFLSVWPLFGSSTKTLLSIFWKDECC